MDGHGAQAEDQLSSRARAARGTFAGRLIRLNAGVTRAMHWPTWTELAWLLLIGALGGTGNMLFIAATRAVQASRIAPLPKGMVPFDGDAYVKALQNVRADRLRQWVQGTGRYLVVEGAGHFVHRDAPDLVIEEIRRLIGTAR